jgi:hypothetical protein
MHFAYIYIILLIRLSKLSGERSAKVKVEEGWRVERPAGLEMLVLSTKDIWLLLLGNGVL